MGSDDNFKQVIFGIGISFSFALGLVVGSLIWRSGSDATAKQLVDLERGLALAQERVAELTVANGLLEERQRTLTDALIDSGNSLARAAFTAQSIDQLIDRIIEHVNQLERLYYEVGEVGRAAP